MRVLGIDPGTRHLGWGVVEREGTRLVHIPHGVIDTDTEQGLAPRLIEIDDGLAAVIAEITASLVPVGSQMRWKPEQGVWPRRKAKWVGFRHETQIPGAATLPASRRG